jgi:GNAT superfamily N-acetyltransferase
MRILDAQTPAQIEAIRQLFRQYAESLDIDLGFQGFTKELVDLPGPYAPPGGALLLAEIDAVPAGCVALRPQSPGIAEIKRLFVRPDCRGAGLGRRLSEAVCTRAAGLGYRAVRLDTLERLRPAVRLYESMGFVRISPYNDNPLDGVAWFEKPLG